MVDTFLVVIIIVALGFDFLNGFHDAANSIATVVATKVLSPFKAVLWAASFNALAAFLINGAVANTIAKGIVHIDKIRSLYPANDPHVSTFLASIVFAALIGAILWNIFTWLVGLPTSSSHALIGGFVGAAITSVWLKFHTLQGLLNWGEIGKISIFIVLSPLIGLILGFLNMVLVMWLFKKAHPGKIDRWFRRLQLFSAAAYSLGHGTNDAQKTMGIITFLLIGAGLLHADPGAKVSAPPWVIISCFLAIALGTMSGGWKIVKTMGVGITKLKPVGGFCAETAGAITILGASHFGIPVSTTHTITGAIVGVGATNRLSAVRWGVAGRIVWAWVLTMPLSALVASITAYIIHLIGV